MGLLAFVTSWRLAGLPWPGVGWGWGAESGSLEAGQCLPTNPRSRAWVQGQDAQEARGGRLQGSGQGRQKRGQARRRYFNLINDRIPLRVCFNNQDTLQQVDRMFAVNLHMSSAGAVSINNVRECAGCATASPGARQVAPLSLLLSGGSCQRRIEVGALQTGFFSLWGVPRSSHQNKSSRWLAQRDHCGYDLRVESSVGWYLFRAQMS